MPSAAGGVTVASVAGDGRGTICCFLVVGAASVSGGVLLVFYVDTIKGLCLTVFGVVALLTPCFAVCFAFSKSADIAAFSKRVGARRKSMANGRLPHFAGTPMEPRGRSVSVACIYREGLPATEQATSSFIKT
ncbi:hypothetical protein HPB48_005738 [Haemaphysalis longicornis]|uniref:Uncharacterized protein n=1 Tax=Haemaphysalis longicornis TaxID=44386 RepID=A0A9J6F6U3_HAELO|nr:hypothetical protein HPB48_005738 [Haemaphysalis longicornis]